MRQRRELAFLALTLAASWALGLPAAGASHGLLPRAVPTTPLMALVTWTPAVTAAVLAWRTQGTAGVRALLRPLTRWRIGARWHVTALTLPFAINAVALALHGAVTGAAPNVPGPLPADLRGLPLAAVPMVFLVSSVGEEVGWRGYALPALRTRHGALASSLVIGAVWAWWHVPHFLVAGSAQGRIPFGWYLVSALATAVLFTWLHERTGASLVAVVVLHAAFPVANFLLPVLPGADGDALAYKLSVGVTVVVAALIAVRGLHKRTSRPGPRGVELASA